MKAGNIPHWTKDSTYISEKIRKSTSFIKICLKTRNDPFFIERWIIHHASIVGMDNLIIADNESDDPDVLNIYKKYWDSLFVFQFAGPHDDLQHKRDQWRLLWESVSDSCHFFLFLDTDEFLVWVEGRQWYADERIVNNIRAFKDHKVIPTYLFTNDFLYRDNVFKVGNSKLFRSLFWGKPICAAPLDCTSGYIHNSQIFGVKWLPSTPPNLFLLHLNKLYPEQRLKAIWHTLVSFGDLKQSDSLESLDIDSLLKHNLDRVRRYASEMREIKKLEASTERSKELTETTSIPPQCIKLSSDGSIEYSSQREEKILSFFLGADENPGFRSGLLILNIVTCFNSGGMDAVRTYFSSNHELLSTELDRLLIYRDGDGNPLWIMEMLGVMSDLNYTPVQEFNIVGLFTTVQAKGSNKEPGLTWYYAFMARFHQMRGRLHKARFWWQKVLDISPDNPGAIRFFSHSPERNTSA